MIIENIEIIKLSFPFKSSGQFSAAVWGVGTVDFLLVKVTTSDDGLVGWSETFGFRYLQ
jgi:L-alanine-DL-glutamate epimerase-like enolase superfamily enzyme